MAIVTASLGAGVFHHYIGHSDSRTAKELIDVLSVVVNENAKRLEETRIQVDSLTSDTQYQASLKKMGVFP